MSNDATTPGAPAADQIRVLIVDDHAIARRGISAYLDVLGDIEAVGEASDGIAALEVLGGLQARGRTPHVVLLDLAMPRMDGIETLQEIRRRFPDVAVVVLTSFGETERLTTVMQHGAVGYLLKDAGPEDVAAAIRSAIADEVFIDTALARKLAQAMRTPQAGIGSLTERERTVIALVGQGRSNREIARHLGISERTARTHVSNILGKLGLGSRTQAALLAVKEGLTGPGA